jgi:hypothetical protein
MIGEITGWGTEIFRNRNDILNEKTQGKVM